MVVGNNKLPPGFHLQAWKKDSAAAVSGILTERKSALLGEVAENAIHEIHPESGTAEILH